MTQSNLNNLKRLLTTVLCLPAVLAAAAEEAILAPVTVTSSSVNDVAERRDAATQKIIINRADIEAMGVLTIGDVLGKLPGVEVSTAGATNAMSMRSRGMVRDSVQLLIDGEPMAGGGRMAQGIVGRLPSQELLRVEILRGSSAEVGGSASLSVNLVMAKPLSRESTAFKTAVGVRGAQPLAQTSFTKGGGDKSFSWLLPVTLNHHDMPSRQVLNRSDSSGVSQQDVSQGGRQIEEFVISPRLTWKSGADNLTLSPVIFRSLGRGDTTLQRTDFGQSGNNFLRQDSDSNKNAFDRLRADAEVLCQGFKYTGRLAWSDGVRNADTQRNTQNATGTTSLSTDQSRSKERDHSAALRMDWDASKHALAASVEESAHQRDASLVNGTLGVAETDAPWDQHWTVWLQDEWRASPAVTLSSGLRSESIRYAVDALEQSHQRWLPSVALRWEPAQGWVGRSSLGAGIKPPQLAELTNQPVFSVNANTPLEPDRRGNPDLRPERSVNLELALERYFPRDVGVIAANMYLRHTHDFTERRIQLEGTRWVDRPYNEGFARHWGLELDTKLRADSLGWRGATLRAHLTVPRSAVDDVRLGITRDAREMPRYTLSAGFDQTRADLSYGMSMQYNAGARTQVPAEQSYATEPRTVWDAYALQKLNSKLNLRVSLQNLLGAETKRQMDAFSAANAWSLASTDQGARSILLSLEGKW